MICTREGSEANYPLLINIAYTAHQKVVFKEAAYSIFYARPLYFKQLLLCLKLTYKADFSSSYYIRVKLLNGVCFVDIGVTIETKQWRHWFYVLLILRAFRSKLLK